MKLILLVTIALICTINANPISRSCKCKAVSNTFHFSFHSWDLTSCKFCSCSNPAMVNCEESCNAMVAIYAKGGCGSTFSGSKVKYSWEASSCSSGTSQTEYTCA